MIGMILVWIILISSPFINLGREIITPSKPEVAYSTHATPLLTGDSNLCIVIGGVIGTYSAGGDPGDVYEWIITKSTGEELLNRSGGDQFETIQFLFAEIGEYTVSLKVRRGTNPNFYQEDLEVKIQKGAELALKQDYLVCGDQPVLLKALDPNTPSLSDYTIIWKSLDENGDEVEIGRGNEFLTYDIGYHFVEFYLTNSDGTQACTIRGSTFVGPSIDYKITQSSTQICEGSSISIGTDTPLTGEWSIRKIGAAAKTNLGDAFEISLESSELDGPGTYEVFFSAVDENYPDCPSERKIAFELLESPQISIQNIVFPDDCVTENGSFQITSTTDLDSLEIPELGVSLSSVSAGQAFSYTNLKPKIYSVIATQNGCKITKLVQVSAKNPPATPSPPNQFTPTVTIEPEACSPTGVMQGKVEVDFGQSIGTGEYRLFSDSKGVIDAGPIPINGLLTLNVSSGNYILEQIIDGCTYPNETFSIAKQPQVEFSTPGDFNICDNFEYIPETSQNLLFTLTYPDGTTQSLSSGKGFSLTSEGLYSLKAAPISSSSTLCSRVEDFRVTFSSKFTFEPVKLEKGCFDPIQYVAEIQGLLPDETSIRWINSDNEIVGRGVEFYPATSGLFSLIIQPLASGFCEPAPVEFEVIPPITSVAMTLEATKICPEPGTALVTLKTDEDEVLETEWIFYDLNDQRQELPEFNNLFEIEVDAPGTYEVVAYNKFQCEIGRNLILVEESTLLTLPNLDESYPVCTKDNNLPPIDAGEYETYAWYFEEQLVSSERLYKPTQLGNYRLMVTTIDGCEFEDNFRTYDVCNYQIVYPNAMILGNPDKDFRVLMSEGVTEAELFILNRQGELIHHSSTTDIPMEEPILNWDGKVNGVYVPTGNYVVTIMVRNALYGLEEKEIGSLLVLD
ncbi:hypothetical protein SAMN06265367_10622 [Algoriphagus winogradskyi]|uniref:Ig-like domain-containing protein n=2 Tax=Algoriphagus winogradskyi TaxID=237017 RepID=A0ABY1P847_9BACT|nr:hypothetical protein SAMN06265367_10622 [Algoriphagus winogradskyi]